MILVFLIQPLTVFNLPESTVNNVYKTEKLKLHYKFLSTITITSEAYEQYFKPLNDNSHCEWFIGLAMQTNTNAVQNFAIFVSNWFIQL